MFARLDLFLAAFTTLIAAAGAVFVLHPGSPLVGWQADHALGAGDVAEAARLYDLVADYGWQMDSRKRGLARAAYVYADRLGEPNEGIARWRRQLLEERDSVVRAELRENIGEAHVQAGNPVDAYRAFLSAGLADPANARAPQRLLMAAKHAYLAGESKTARALWRKVAAEYKGGAAEATLWLGRDALLAHDVLKANEWFDKSVKLGGPEHVQMAAKLGVATTLERLGDLDEAIAEIDDSELPDEVRESRLDALRLRQLGAQP